MIAQQTGRNGCVRMSMAVGLIMFSTLAAAQQLSVSQPQIFVQTAHSEGFSTLVISARNRYAVSADLNGVINVWDIKSAKQVRRFKVALASNPITITADEKTVVVGVGNDLWALSIEDGSRRIVASGLEGLNAVQASPVGDWVACGDVFGSVSVINLARNEQRLAVRTIQHKSYSALTMGEITEEIRRTRPQIMQLRFSSDGKLLAWMNNANAYGAVALRPLRPFVSGTLSDGQVASLAFNPKGHLLIGALNSKRPEDLLATDSHIQVTDVSSKRLLIDVPALHKGGVWFNSTGTVATMLIRTKDNYGSTETQLDLWTIPSALRSDLPTTIRSSTYEAPVAISDDGNVLAVRSASSSSSVVVLNVKSASRSVMTGAFVEEVKRVDFWHDSLIIAGARATALWDPISGEPAHAPAAALAASARDGKWTVQVAPDQSLVLTKNDRPQVRTSIPAKGPFGEVRVTVDGEAVVWTTDLGFGGDAWLWRAWDGTVTKLCYSEARFGSRTKLAVSPQERFVAVSCGIPPTSDAHFSEVLLIDSHSGRTLSRTEVDFSTSLSFSSDSARLAIVTPAEVNIVSTSGDGSPQIIDTPDRGRPMGQVLFGPEDQSLLVSFTGFADGSDVVRQLSLPKGAILNTVTVNADVNSLARTNQLLAAGSSDGTVALIDLATFSKTLTILDGVASWIAVSPEGLFDGTPDGMREVEWRVGTGAGLVPLEAFYADYFHPGLVGEALAGAVPHAAVNIGPIVQLPGLRYLLAHHRASLVTDQSSLSVCFVDPPNVALNLPAGEPILPLEHDGFVTNPDDASCRFSKRLAVPTGEIEAFKEALMNWTGTAVATPWDGQLSDTRSSTLHLLTIAVTDYAKESRLSYAVPSAQELERIFERQQTGGVYAGIDTSHLYNADATIDAIKKQFAELTRRSKPDDVVVIYLAGHGRMSSKEEMFYFLPVDAEDSTADASGLSTAMLAEILRHLPARRIVLFIDACQSGGAAETLAQIAQARATGELRRFGTGDPTSAKQQEGIGLDIIAAALPLAYAVQADDKRSALLAAMLSALDRSPSLLTIQDLAKYIEMNLPVMSENTLHFRQVPIIESIGLDFPFAQR